MGKYMKITKTKLDGVVIVEPNIFQDERGFLIKTFHKDFFRENGMEFDYEENYFTISKKNVLRGMHFQAPPKDHIKLVYVVSGAVLDVVLDIRKGSPTYGEYIEVELSAQNRKIIYMSTGFAHGYLSLIDNTCVIYLQSTMYSLEHQGGIKADSFGMNWGVRNLIIKDETLPMLKNFKTPFIY